MAAPAHLLVALHDRCCDWTAAHAVYDSFAVTGVRPDAQTFGAMVRALWSCGSLAGCLLALRVFEHACQQGVFKLSVNMDDGDTRVVFTLPAVGPEMALVALWRLLRELRGRLATDGPGILRQRVLLLVGRGDPMDGPSPTTAAAMRTICAIPGCPLALLDPTDPESASTAATTPVSVRLTARSDALAHWLSSAAYATAGPAALLLPPETILPLSPSELLSHQEAAIAAASALYSQLSASAAADAASSFSVGGPQIGSGSGSQLDALSAALQPPLLVTHGSGMSAPGGGIGGGVCSSGPSVSASTPAAPTVGAIEAISSSSTSVVLDALDGASGIPSPLRRATPSASAASLALSADGGASMRSVPTQAAPRVQTPLGIALAAQLPSTLPTPFIGARGRAASTEGSGRAGSASPSSSAAAAAAAPGAAVAALSVLCGALLTGAGALPLGTAPPDTAVIGTGARDVTVHAAAHPLARGLSPRRVAELSLVATRRAAGLWPAWPRVLVPITSCSDPEADVARPELCAFISALATAAAAGATTGNPLL